MKRLQQDGSASEREVRMPTAVAVALGVFGVMALIAVIVAAAVTAATTSSYDKSLTGNPGDED